MPPICIVPSVFLTQEKPCCKSKCESPIACGEFIFVAVKLEYKVKLFKDYLLIASILQISK